MGAQDTSPDMKEGSSAFRYRAFISYSHSDEAQAQRLHRRLERYRVPKALRDRHASLRPIFRDREDLAAASELSHAIQEALDDSENLIVICSPRAAASHWVNQEISYFKSLGRAGRIFTVIAEGTPPGDERACMPEAITQRVGPDGALAEPLAADFRATGDGIKLGTLKLISGLLDIKLDELVRRDLVCARQRMVGVMAGSFAIIAALMGLTWATYSAEQDAQVQKAEAESFVEFLLSDLSGQLETYGRLDLLESVGDRALGYYAQFETLGEDAVADGRRARALHFVGQVQDSLGETSSADDYFLRSYAITKAAMAQDDKNPDRIFEHARSAFLMSVPLRRAGQYSDELTYLREYVELSERLEAAEPNSDRARAELALAKMNVGRVEYRTGDSDTAQRQLQAASTLFEDIAMAEPTVRNYLNYTESLSWLAETYRAVKDYEQVYRIRGEQTRTLEARYEAHPDDFRYWEAVIYAKLGLGNAARDFELFEESLLCNTEALEGAEQALRLEPDREKMLRAKVAALTGLMLTHIKTGDFETYRLERQRLEEMRAQPMSDAVSTSYFWTESLPSTLARVDQAYQAALESRP